MARFRPTDDEAPPVNTEEDRQIWETIKRVAPQTWPGKAISEAIDAGTNLFTLPKRVISGETDPMSEEAFSQSAAGMNLLAGSGVARGLLKGADPTGDVGIGAFFGQKSLRADHRALARAKQLADAGVNEDEILAATKWFRDVEGNWMYESDDSVAKLRPYDPAKTKSTLGEELDYPEAYEAYPDLANTILHRNAKEGTGWSLRPHPGSKYGEIGIPAGNTTNNPMNDPLSIALHELNHGVGAREGFPGGSSPDFVRQQLEERAIQEARESPESYDQVKTLLESFVAKHPDDQERIIHNLYLRNPGEAASNATQMRQKLTAFERLLQHPRHDMDIAAGHKPLVMPYKDINEY